MKKGKIGAKPRKKPQKVAAAEPIAVVEEPTYQELNRIPNLHMLKKPSWAIAPKEAQKEKNFEFAGISFPKDLWKSLFSIPMLLILSLPLLVVLTLACLSSYPSSLPQFLKDRISSLGSYGLASLGAVGIIVFVPWSILVCTFESWVGEQFDK